MTVKLSSEQRNCSTSWHWCERIEDSLIWVIRNRLESRNLFLLRFTNLTFCWQNFFFSESFSALENGIDSLTIRKVMWFCLETLVYSRIPISSRIMKKCPLNRTIKTLTNRGDLFILLIQNSNESWLWVEKTLQKKHLKLSFMDSFKKLLSALCEMLIDEWPSVKDFNSW